MMANEANMQEIRADYERFLVECGLTHEVVEAIVTNEADMVPMPPQIDTLELRDSPIQGKGLFSTRTLQAGERIAPARIYPMRTPAGRYTNHSTHPNAMMVPLSNGDIDMVAMYQIEAGEEVTVNYRQALRANVAAQEMLDGEKPPGL